MQPPCGRPLSVQSKSCACQRKKHRPVVNLGKTPHLGQQECHQPERPKRANVRVLKDGQPLFPVAERAQRVAGVAQAVQMNAAGHLPEESALRSQRKTRLPRRNARKMRTRTTLSHRSSTPMSGGKPSAHRMVCFSQFTCGTGIAEYIENATKSPLITPFHGCFPSFTGSKIPHTDSYTASASPS